MDELDSLIEAIIMEAAALTKGSQRVMNDKNMVANLADAIRDDARSNPKAFATGFWKTSQKATDESLAQWFLENIDTIEKEGYDGVVYSRDGVNSEWIARRYIAGSHNWEDLVGVMNMNLRDWYVLKNRNMLDANHRDIPKFSSVRDIGKYMNVHYEDRLKDVRDAAKNAAINKVAKSACVVDNDDYKIYTVFNWAAARRLGLGTQWCTANSSSDANYNTYSDRAMLFQLYPKDAKEIVKTGKIVGKETRGTEKYQFDAGHGGSFNDLADDPASTNYIKETFPFLYTDLVAGLNTNKSKMQEALDALSQDETLNSNKEGKIKKYDIDKEIDKLSMLKRYFTDKVRPKAKPAEEPSEPGAEMPAQPQLGNEPQPQGQQAMENVDKDVAAMLQSLKKYDILAESIAPVLGMKTLTGSTPISEKNAPKTGDTLAQRPKNMMKDYGNEVKGIKKADPEEYKKAFPIDGPAKGKKLPEEKVAESADTEVLEWMQRFSKLGNMKGYGR
jgi:hypothetical protein